MLKQFFAFLMLLGSAAPLYAQATSVATSATLPTSCTVGNVYSKTGSSAGFYVCLTTNTWTAAGGTVTGGTCTNQVATAISASGVPTCTTLTGAYVDSSIGLTASALSQFAATTSAQLAGVLSDETGSGKAVFATSPTFITPLLGTPTSGVMTNVTGLPESGLTLTDVTTANVSSSAHGFAPKFPNNTTTFLRGDGTYAVPPGTGTGTVTSVATTSPITGGTFTTSGTIACATCGVTGTGLQQFASTTSAQLAGVLSDETGSGLAVFQTSPTIITPTIASLVNMTHSHGSNAGGGSSIGPLTGGLTVNGGFSLNSGTLTVAGGSSIIAFTGGGTQQIQFQTGPGVLTNTSATSSSTLTMSTSDNSGDTAAITVKSGSIAALSGNTGAITIDPGSTVSGTSGTLNLGNANAGAVVIGHNGINTTINEHVTSGTTPTVANVGANSCGTSAASIAGDDNSGNITVGATSGSQCRIVFAVAAPTRRNCTASDETTGNLVRTTYVDTTHTDILGTMLAGDVISYICFAR